MGGSLAAAALGHVREPARRGQEAGPLPGAGRGGGRGVVIYGQNLPENTARAFRGGGRPQWGSGQRGCAEDRQGVQEAWPTGWFLSQGIECLATKSCMHLAVCFLLRLVQATECFFSSFKERVATNSSCSIFL